MKFFRIFGRSFRDSFKSIGRNFSLSLASITCVIITLVIVGVALLLSTTIIKSTDEFENDNLSIIVFVSNDADEFDLTTIETKIKGIKNVDTTNVTLKTKAEIKQEIMETNETYKTIMENWDDNENPLQNAFIVKVLEPSKIMETKEEIEKIDKLSLVKCTKEYVDPLLTAFNAIKKGSYIAVIALIVVTVFLIINTIKLTIFSRKREISIMRLVGASNISIKLPFVFEGLFIGIIGSIIPIVLMVYSYNWVYKTFKDQTIVNSLVKLLPPGDILLRNCLIVFAIGTIVGMIGSAMAVRKHLKV